MRRRARRDALTFIAFIAPNFLLLAVFTFWPILYSLYLSFFKWNMIAKRKTFLALDNYRAMITDPVFWMVTRNTFALAAFTAGLEQKADALELDVHLSRDGELVVIHDPALARTTDTAGEVGDKTLAELRTLDASARWFGPPVGRQLIPTLQEVVDLAKGRASLQVEIKVKADGARYPGIESKVVETLRNNGTVEETVVLSFDFPTLVTIRSLEPRLRTCALVSRAYLSKVGKRGLGVDFITSNRPDLLRETLASRDGSVGP